MYVSLSRITTISYCGTGMAPLLSYYSDEMQQLALFQLRIIIDTRRTHRAHILISPHTVTYTIYHISIRHGVVCGPCVFAWSSEINCRTTWTTHPMSGAQKLSVSWGFCECAIIYISSMSCRSRRYFCRLTMCARIYAGCIWFMSCHINQWLININNCSVHNREMENKFTLINV